MKSKSLHVATCLLTLCCCATALISPDLSSSQVYVDDVGRYQNLIISINLKMAQLIDEKDYLEDVKTHVRWLSRAVYDGTGLQFGNVTILVPSHWKDSSYSKAFNHANEAADMLIQPLEEREMYTQHIQGCGSQALFMAVDAVYIKRYNNNEAKAKKQLYHEWMHSRYGVFDEHPVEGRKDVRPDPTAIDQQKFYHSSHLTLEPVRCSLALETSTACKMSKATGYKDIDTQMFLPKSYCTFSILAPASPSPSLMTSYELDNVELLCTDDTHNDEAPNRQNRLCNGRSVTEVAKGHNDFKKLDEVIQRSSMARYSKPSFSVERLIKSRTIVFVLDTSKSMKGPRLFLATQAIGSMIEHIIEDYASVMIVTFAGSADKLYPKDSNHPVELDSTERRKEVVDSLTNITTGSFTCIGCGLEKAYDLIMNSPGGTASGTFFVLLTDGADNVNQKKIDEMFDKSSKEAFFIDTILLAEQADDSLVDLARGTGSRIFSATDDPSALVDAFTEIITNRQNLSSQVIQIYSEMRQVKPNQNISGSFVVEKHLVELAEIVFYWNVSAQPHLSFSLVRENDGKVLLDKTNASTTKLGYLKLLLADGEEVDDDTISFKYYIKNSHPSVQLISTVTVNSRTAENEGERRRSRRDIGEDNHNQAYGMTSFINGESNFTFSADGAPPLVSIHAYLPAGSTSGPSDEVVATVTVDSIDSETTDEFLVELRDFGTGPDVIGADNIFSAYFTNFVTYNATYYVRIRARGDEFMRYSSTGYFAVYIDSDVNVAARLPPAAILDLQVVETQVNQVTVSFTAPGADLDFGIATYYRAWCSASSKEMRQGRNHTGLENFTLRSITPRTSYNREEITVNIPDEFSTMNTTVWIGLTAIDNYGLESNMSNLVSSRYMPDVAAAAIQVSTTESTCPTGTIIRCFPDLYFYIIIGSLAALLILILCLCLFFCLCRRKRSEKDKKELHNVDSPTTSSSSIGKSEYLGEMDMASSDMALQDEIEIPNGVINTLHPHQLPFTKKRVPSLNWSKSLKRLSRKSHKPPAPAPPSKETETATHSVIAKDMKRKRTKQNGQLNAVWVSSKTNKSVPAKPLKTDASAGVEHLHTERPAPQPQHFDTSNMDSDVQTGEQYCAGYISEQAEHEYSAISEENPNICA